MIIFNTVVRKGVMMGENGAEQDSFKSLMEFLSNSTLRQKKELISKIKEKIREDCIKHLTALLLDLSLIKAARDDNFEKFKEILEKKISVFPSNIRQEMEKAINEVCSAVVEMTPEMKRKEERSDELIRCAVTGRILTEEEVEEILMNEEACRFVKEKLKELHSCIEDQDAEKYLKILQEMKESVYINLPEVEMIVAGYTLLFVIAFSRKLKEADETFSRIYSELYEVRSMMYPQLLESWLKRLLAVYFHIIGDYERSNMICNELLLLEENPSIRASLLNLMSWNYDALGQAKKAEESLKRLFQIPSHAIHPYLDALRLNRAEVYYFSRGELEEASKYGREGVKIAERFGYKKLKETLEYNLMIILRELGKLEEAEQFFKKDLDKSIEERNFDKAIVSLVNLLTVYIDDGRLEEAMKVIEKYEDQVIPKVAVKSNVLVYKLTKAECLVKLKRLNEAIKIINEIVPEISGIRELEAQVYNLMGLLLIESKDYDKAVSYLTIARSYYELSGKVTNVAFVLLDIVEAYLRKAIDKEDCSSIKAAEALLSEVDKVIKERKYHLVKKKYDKLLPLYNEAVHKLATKCKSEGEKNYEGNLFA